MDHTVVTIYCCGTAFHRDRMDYTVPYSWRVTRGDRTWINDGPGNTGHHILKTEAILKKVESGKDTPDDMFDNRRSGGKIGQVLGTGSQDNIVTTLQWLWMEYYRRDKPKFRTINLVGWSRGAVTCIMLAHAIEAAGFRGLIPGLRVNICAIDPVPGGVNDFGGESFDSTGRTGSPRTLSRCVTEYVGILAENVGSSSHHTLKGMAFHNVSPNFGPAANAGATKTEYPLPGSHADVANFNFSNPSGRIAASICHDFLIRNGTALEFDKTLSDEDIAEFYAWTLRDHGKMKTKGIFRRKKVFRKGGAAVDRKCRVANAMRDHPFYVNAHHAEVLQRLDPVLAARIDNDEPLSEAEQRRIYLRRSETYNVLSMMGMVGLA